MNLSQRCRIMLARLIASNIRLDIEGLHRYEVDAQSASQSGMRGLRVRGEAVTDRLGHSRANRWVGRHERHHRSLGKITGRGGWAK